MPKIGVFCKTSFTCGIGHLVRQTHIANILRNRGHKITFFIPDYSFAQYWLDQQQFTYKNETLREMEAGHLDLVIIDIQDTTKAFIKNFKQYQKPVVSFEDLGEGRNHVDLLIDCNLDEKESEGLSVQTLFGTSYSVLAEEFETFHSRNREFKGPINSILITLGGTDPHSLTLELAKKLIRIQPELSMTLLAGPGSKNISALKDLETKKVKILTSTPQMAPILFDHDAVFCAGGVTLHEAMAVGTPAFVINQVAHQTIKAMYAEKQGAAINLGTAESWQENRLKEILRTPPDILQKMSGNGKNLIDGKGLKRVTDEIELLCRKSLRKERDGNDGAQLPPTRPDSG